MTGVIPSLLRSLFTFSALLATVGFLPLSAAQRAAYIVTNKVMEGLTSPLGIENAGDGSGRLFIVGKKGTIHIARNGVVSAQPFLDITERVKVTGEGGLLGLAFPPDFSTKKCFYVFYCDSDEVSTISRFHLSEDPDQADPLSEEIILKDEIAGGGHVGGQIAFGPDDYLYISKGDIGFEKLSQRPDSLHGKMLRIDVNTSSPGLPYGIPAVNPHASSGPDGPRKEILYSGLRNPWRFSFDSATGDLFISDVGGGREEEVNVVRASAINDVFNFGWPVREGKLPTNHSADLAWGPVDDPIHSYNGRGFRGHCITGGYIYRGPNPLMEGMYIFGDYMSGNIWGMDRETGATRLLAETGQYIASFGTDEEGNLYYADIENGIIYSLDAPANLPPPVADPPPGTYSSSVLLWDISSSVPGATVRYTTDGSPPNESSPEFPDYLPIEHPTRLLARVFHPDLDPSPITEFYYQLTTLTPRPYFSASSTSSGYHFTDSVYMSLGGDEETDIYYTLDGSTPTTNSQKFNPEQPILIEKSCLVSTLGIRRSEGWAPSEIGTFNVILKTAPALLHPPQVAPFEPIDMICDTPDATIHYTLDGSPPTTSSPIWTGPKVLPPQAILTTLTVKGEMEATHGIVTISTVEKTLAEFRQIGGARLIQARDVTVTSTGELYALNVSSIYRVNETSSEIYHTSHGHHYDLISHHPKMGFVLARRTNTIYPEQIGILTPNSEGQPTYRSFFYTTPIWDILALETIVLMPSEYFHIIASFRTVDNTPLQGTFAGTGNRGYQDGMDTLENRMSFDEPSGIASVDYTNFYVTERAGNRVRHISIEESILGRNVSTYAGTSIAGWTDGPKATSRFESPSAVAADHIGNVYVTDGPPGARRIRKISPDGWTSTLHGPLLNQAGDIIQAEAAGHTNALGMDVDRNGIVYYANGLGVFKITQEDWDNDGIPDEIERQLGAPFVVGADDRKVDSDGDGFSNAAEWIAGTKPADAADKPAGQSALRHENNSIHLLFPATPGSTREVEYSDDLETWYPTGPITTSEQPTHTASERMPAGVPARFYRMKEVR